LLDGRADTNVNSIQQQQQQELNAIVLILWTVKQNQYSARSPSPARPF
jgi:hypothetical protein